MQVEHAESGEVLIRVHRKGVEQLIAAAHGEWRKGRLAAAGDVPEQAVAVSGAWADVDTYVARLCFYESPHHLIMKMRFDGDQLILDSEYNVTFGPTQQPRLIGEAR